MQGSLRKTVIGLELLTRSRKSCVEDARATGASRYVVEQINDDAFQILGQKVVSRCT